MQNSCPICLETFNTKEDCLMVNCCKAKFHLECIKKWLISQKKHSNCPCCREDINIKFNYSYYICNSISLVTLAIYIIFLILLFTNINNSNTVGIYFTNFLSGIIIVPLLIYFNNKINQSYYCKRNFVIKSGIIYTTEIFNPIFNKELIIEEIPEVSVSYSV